MPVHDWTRVESGIFHDFHMTWIGQLRTALNDGVLPEGYYALAEQHAGHSIADVLTLHESARAFESLPSLPRSGGTAVAEVPPKVRRRLTIEPAARIWRRTLAIRHISGHRLVALLEILSPANKDRRTHVEEFATKVIEAMRADVHVLLVDLLPPGRHDPRGMHDIIYQMLEESEEQYDLPAEEPLTLASYVADTPVEVYIEHLAVGTELAEMPLFLNPDNYVATPLESTYLAAYEGMPAFWRNVLEGRSQAP